MTITDEDENHTQCTEAARRLVDGWEDASLTVRPLLGGLSNKLYLVYADPPASPSTAVMRLFCTSNDLVNREYEQNLFLFLDECGFGPHVYGTDQIWRAEQYLPGVPLKLEQLSEPETLAIVSDLVAQFHGLSPPETVAPDTLSTVLNQLDKWVGAALHLASKIPQDPLAERLRSSKSDFDKTLRPLLLILDSPIVFCHNDVQEGNVLRSEDGDFFLIDYEYANWNYRGYDLANVLCECIIDNNAADNESGFSIRPELRPTQQALELMAYSYLSRSTSRPVSSNQVKELIQEILLFQPVSHLLWAAWAAAKTWSSTSIRK